MRKGLVARCITPQAAQRMVVPENSGTTLPSAGTRGWMIIWTVPESSSKQSPQAMKARAAAMLVNR